MPQEDRPSSHIVRLVAAVLVLLLVGLLPGRPPTPAYAAGAGGTITVSGGGDVPLGSTFTLSFRLDDQPNPYSAWQISLIYASVSAGGSLRYQSRIIDWVTGNTPLICPSEGWLDADLGYLPPPLRMTSFVCVDVGEPPVTGGPLARTIFKAEAIGATAIHMFSTYAPDNGGLDLGTFTYFEGPAGPDAQQNTLACSGSCGPLAGFPMTQPWDAVVNVVPAEVDTDGDGYTDAQEIALGKSPTTFCKAMRADVNMDGKANLLDLGAIAGWFGQNVPPAPERYDQREPPRDNKINLLDLGAAASVYGLSVSTCP